VKHFIFILFRTYWLTAFSLAEPGSQAALANYFVILTLRRDALNFAKPVNSMLN